MEALEPLPGKTGEFKAGRSGFRSPEQASRIATILEKMAEYTPDEKEETAARRLASRIRRSLKRGTTLEEYQVYSIAEGAVLQDAFTIYVGGRSE